MSIFGVSPLYDFLIISTIIFWGIIANLFSKRISEKFNLIDYPSKSILKIQKKPIPLSGGIAIFFILALGLILFRLLKSNFASLTMIISLLIVMFCVLIAGILDDRLKLSAGIRLLFYIVLAFAAFIIFRSYLAFDFIIILITIFVFAPGIISSVNMIDGNDGVCAGMSIISFAGFLILGLNPLHYNQTLIFFSLAGLLATIPFLFFKFHPARVFLGSSGSELLGFLLFTLILISMRGAPQYLLPLRILLIGIPVIDLVRVIIVRLKVRKALIVGDRNHIYDVLSRMGFKKRKVWLIMALAQSTVVLIALIVNNLLTK